MDWHTHHPERDELVRWWTIDPQTGKPDGAVAAEAANCHCLGESALDDVDFVADALATSFATKGFTDEEISALMLSRALPSSFQGGPEDAAELLEHVDDLWCLAETNYMQALHRPPNEVERHWLYHAALESLRARGG
jgi:hypothetical protein